MIPTSYQWHQVTSGRSFGGDSGDKTYPIPTGKAISRLWLDVICKNGSNHNSADAAAQQTVIEALSKIEVQTGSRVLFTGSAEIARAWATMRDGKAPYFDHTQIAGTATDPVGWQHAIIPFNFQRYDGDPYCCLPAPLYEDGVDIVMDFDFTIDNDAGFITNTAKFAIYAETITPTGATQAEWLNHLQSQMVLQKTKKTDYTTLASGTENLQNSTSKQNKLRTLMYHCYEAGILEGVDISALKLEVDSVEQQYAPWKYLQQINANDIDLKYEQIMRLKANGTTDEIWTRIPDVIPTLSPNMLTTAAHEGPFCAASGDKVTVTTEAADDLNTLTLRSPVIPCTAFWSFDKDLSMRHLMNMDVNEITSVVTNGGAAGALSLHEEVLAPALYR
jgi:hypothetical protein